MKSKNPSMENEKYNKVYSYKDFRNKYFNFITKFLTLSTEHFIFSKDTKEPLAIPPQHLFHQISPSSSTPPPSPKKHQTNKIHMKHHSTTMRPLLLKLSVVKIRSNATHHEKNTTLSETQNFQGKSAPPPHKAQIWSTYFHY